MANLARRVDRTDAAGDTAAERKLEALAVELIRRVDAVKAETEGRIKTVGDDKLDRLEGALKDIATKVGESEKRSSEAVDRMGREVMRVAQSMSHRVQAVETRSAQASEQMGSEMARIADAMDGRMRPRRTGPKPKPSKSSAARSPASPRSWPTVSPLPSAVPRAP